MMGKRESYVIATCSDNVDTTTFLKMETRNWESTCKKKFNILGDYGIS